MQHPSKEKEGCHLRIRNGFRQFVDKGSAIASDMMMECPQVALDEIFAVSLQDKHEALGQSMQEETKNDAALNTHKDLTPSLTKDADDQDLTTKDADAAKDADDQDLTFAW